MRNSVLTWRFHRGYFLLPIHFLNYKQLLFLDSCSGLSGAFRNRRLWSSPGSFAQWGNSCEKACGCSSPCSSSPWAWRFTGHWPGWLPFVGRAAGRLHQWQVRNRVCLLCLRSFCGKHRPTQDIQRGKAGEESCVLCCEDLSQASVENIQSPCCSQTIYHRKCIQVGFSLPWGPSTFFSSSEHPRNAQAVLASVFHPGGLCAGRVPDSQRKVSPVSGRPWPARPHPW